MIKVKDAKGREIMVSVYGSEPDDIQIDEAYYVSETDPEEVSDETIDYILVNFADKLEEAWYNIQVGRAEYLAENPRGT